MSQPSQASNNSDSAALALPPGPQKPKLASKLSATRVRQRLANKRLRHVLLSLLISLLTFIIWLGMAFGFEVKDVKYNIPLKQPSLTNMTIVANYLAIDPGMGAVVIDWYPLGNTCNPRDSRIIDFYFDPNLILDGSSRSDDPPSTPIFTFNSTGRCPPTSIKNSFATFRTNIKLTGDPAQRGRRGPSLQDYPFDRYLAQVSMFAQDSVTNASIPIVAGETYGIPVNFKIQLDRQRSSSTEEGLFIVLQISRSSAVKILAIVITLGNWLVTFVFIGITVAAVMFNEKVLTEMIAIPIASLFAFTTVRANLPGAPSGFGAFIDYIGILPNLAIMTICAGALLTVVLWRRIKDSMKFHLEGNHHTPSLV